MHQRVFITGIGIVSAIGNGTVETLQSLHGLNTGIGKLSLFKSVHSDVPVGEVKHSNDGIAGLLGMIYRDMPLSRNTLLAMVASEQAVNSSGWNDLQSEGTGAVFATTVGGMDLNEQYYQSLLRDGSHKEFIEMFDSADFTEKVATRFGIRHITTISTACSSSANAVMVGARLIRSKRLRRVLVCGSDSLTRFALNGFLALEILSPTGCRPFDKHRNGLTIGEGAAALVLESEDMTDPSRVICEVTGYANVNEAFHATASSAEGTGATMAMNKALETSGLQPADISYINAHGTGTEINDLSEGVAIDRVFGKQVPAVSSTKAFTGHTLGAAGAVEAVFSALAIQQQILLPGLNFKERMPELSFQPVQKVVTHPVHHVMSNSFGFGGSNTTLIFSKA
jgi:3-oxoacyl-[acyl-carrier-protein] synthase II